MNYENLFVKTFTYTSTYIIFHIMKNFISNEDVFLHNAFRNFLFFTLHFRKWS